MNKRRGAYELISAAFRAMRGTFGEREQKALLGGLTGRPLLFEDKTDAYERRLKGVLRTWALSLRRAAIVPGTLPSALTVLERQISDVVQDGLPQAYRLGKGGRPLTLEDEQRVQRKIDRSLGFVRGNLMPGLEARIFKQGEDEDFEEGGSVYSLVVGRMGALEAYVGLYAGDYWTTIWMGFEAAFRDVFGALDIGPEVRRVLDPRAKHCATCPPKARDYRSWAEMLMLCGGLPGDGSDDCHSNCRCRLQVLLGGWVYEV